MNRPRTIFIDWDGTLNRHQFWQTWRDDLDYKNAYDSIEQELFTAKHQILNDWMIGKVSAEQVVRHLEEKVGVEASILLSELKSSCEAMSIEPSALAAVKKARANGHKVYIATDNMDTFSRWTVPALKLLENFDGVFSSDVIGHLKREVDANGESKFFQAVLNDLAISPREAVMIDDSADTQIVENMGIKFVKIDKPADVADAIVNTLSVL